MARIDLKNQHFTRLLVLEETSKRKNGCVIWKCQCDCGKIIEVSSHDLRQGRVKSCGCLKKEIGRKTRKDISNQRFGYLVAIYPIYNNENKHAKWHCICDCGNECEVGLPELTRGQTLSCGCLVSKEEKNIEKMLKDNQIKYVSQYRFNNLPNKKFDFFIDNKYVLEFDGRQHFEYTGAGWNNKENFIKTRTSDLKKNKYCFDNNIPIIRIPYSKKYTINDLKIETTRFLLTPENEKEYYESRGVKYVAYELLQKM